MKPALKIVLIVVLAVAIAVSAGFLLFRHFVTNRIMDRGGMENPDVIYPLDGDFTYVDNSVLWPVLEGTWESEDGRWQAVIGEESGVVLRMDGETVLKSTLYFTYLRPGEVVWTELLTDSYELVSPDGTALGKIKEFGHEAGSGEDSGTLVLKLKLPEGGEETVTFQKA